MVSNLKANKAMKQEDKQLITIVGVLGKQLADAAVGAGVQRIVFSSLENVDEITQGKKFTPHFTDKAMIEEYIRTLSITSSFIYMAFFYTNFMDFYTPLIEGDTLVFPIYLPKDFHAPFVYPLTATGASRFGDFF